MQDKIQEIMGLVDDFGLKAEAYSHQEVTAKELISARRLIESKLRELVENKLSVREPLSDEQRLLIWQHVSLRGVAKPSYDTWFQAGISAAERAHNITKES